MRKIKIFLTILLVLSCYSCAKVSRENISTPTVLPTHQSSIKINTPDVLPTMTSARQIPSITPASEIGQPTTSTPSKPSFVEKCVPILDETTAPRSSKGVIFVNTLKDGVKTYIETLETGETKTIGNTTDSVASADGKLIAYLDINLKSIQIIDKNGNIIRSIPAGNQELSPFYWVDEDHIFLSQGYYDPNEPTELPSILAINVQTGEQEKWLPNLPDIDVVTSVLSWKNRVAFIPDPTMKLVVYRNNVIKSGEEEELGLTLYDTKSQKIIIRMDDLDYGHVPRWSRNGSEFLTTRSLPVKVDKYELFSEELASVSRDGHIQLLTQMSLLGRSKQFDYQWSYDNRKIGFLNKLLDSADAEETSSGTFMVLNLDSNIVTSYCVEGDTFVWSPDSRFALVNHTSGRNSSITYIVDLEDFVAWIYKDGVKVEGWVN